MKPFKSALPALLVIALSAAMAPPASAGHPHDGHRVYAGAHAWPPRPGHRLWHHGSRCLNRSRRHHGLHDRRHDDRYRDGADVRYDGHHRMTSGHLPLGYNGGH